MVMYFLRYTRRKERDSSNSIFTQLCAIHSLQHMIKPCCSYYWNSIPFSGWWCLLECGRWLWCRTCCLHLLARWCTLLQHSSQCLSHGLWFCQQLIPLLKTQGLGGERSLETHIYQAEIRLIHYPPLDLWCLPASTPVEGRLICWA